MHDTRSRFPDIPDEAYPAYIARHTKALNVHATVRLAIAKGKLIRPDTCELCGRKPGCTQDGRPKIQAHYWRGYDARLDVWWVCNVCNSLLWGEEFHNGSVTKSQARKFVMEYYKVVAPYREPHPCKAVVKTTGEPCKMHTTHGDYCVSHRRAIERGNYVQVQS